MKASTSNRIHTEEVPQVNPFSKPHNRNNRKSSVCLAGALIYFLLLSLGNFSSLHAQGISLEEIPPVVVKTHPQAGDDGVDANLSEIKVTFSKEMLPTAFSIVQLTAESFPAIEGKPRYLDDLKTCVLDVHLEAGKTYALWFNTDRYRNFKDAQKISAIPYLLVFKTKAP